MISFIIIGRNEGWKLTKCFESVFNTIQYNNIKEYEVIYVDSDSTDNSIEIAKCFPQIKIYPLTADHNAAIARNLGANKSNGDVLFFIDGDMEIQSDFLKEVYKEGTGLVYDFVSGDYLNFYYNRDNNLLKKENYFKYKFSKIEKWSGGLFLIKMNLWYYNNGMRNIFKRSQDIDFGLRLANKGVFLYRIPTIAAYHHTINYNDSSRKWKMLLNLDELYGRALLYRLNFFNRHTYNRLFRLDYSLVSLFILLLISLIYDDFLFLFLYVLIVIARSLMKNKSFKKEFFEDILYFHFRDIQQLFGFLLFWPKNKFNIEYEVQQKSIDSL